jgi:hypothetical protein
MPFILDEVVRDLRPCGFSNCISNLMAKEVLETQKLVDSAATSFGIRKVLKLVVRSAEGHTRCANEISHFEQSLDFCRRWKHIFPSVA